MLMAVHQERLGRSLDRLSTELYSKDAHFVLELIQVPTPMCLTAEPTHHCTTNTSQHIPLYVEAYMVD